MGPTQTLPVKRLERLLTRADNLAVWTHAQGYLMSTVEPRAAAKPAEEPISLARSASRQQERRAVIPS